MLIQNVLVDYRLGKNIFNPFTEPTLLFSIKETTPETRLAENYPRSENGMIPVTQNTEKQEYREDLHLDYCFVYFRVVSLHVLLCCTPLHLRVTEILTLLIHLTPHRLNYSCWTFDSSWLVFTSADEIIWGTFYTWIIERCR